jgi:hypothetical protein
MPAASKKATAKYSDLRARLIRQGMTLRKFALKRRYPVGTVYDAASGRRAGVKATKIREELEELIYGV